MKVWEREGKTCSKGRRAPVDAVRTGPVVRYPLNHRGAPD